jgi:hypothetical protein
MPPRGSVQSIDEGRPLRGIEADRTPFSEHVLGRCKRTVEDEFGDAFLVGIGRRTQDALGIGCEPEVKFFGAGGADVHDAFSGFMPTTTKGEA